MTPKESQNLKLVELKLDEICEDDRYSFSFPSDPPALFESVNNSGVLQPVWVTRSTDGLFNLISGFRRLSAARKVPIETIMALVFEDRDPYELFLLSLEESATFRTFNQIELAFIVSAATGKFGKSFNELIDVLFPLLGLSKSRYIYKQLLELAKFGSASHTLIASLKMPLGSTKALSDYNADDRETICLWLAQNNFGLNKSVKLIEMVFEICAIEKISVTAVIEEAEAGVPIDMELPQRGAELFDNITNRRNPTLADMQARFNLSVKELKLPPGIKVNPPKNFEGKTLDFVIKAGNAKTATDCASALSEADKEKLDKLFDSI